MKKFYMLVILLSIIIYTVSAEKPHLDGTWKDGNIELTFNEDTLLIDEIDNEGDVYVFSMDSVNNIINAHSDFHLNDSFSLKIVRLTENTLSLYYLDDDEKTVYSFKRKK